jgi:hypothetical protein
MAIPKELLKLTDGRALGAVVYGGPGTRKTFGVHTLPPKVRLDDWEGGAHSLTPWIHRKRKWNEMDWLELSDADRQEAFDLLSDDNKAYIQSVTRIKPGPYIDVIWWDNMDVAAYGSWVLSLANFPLQTYSSYACDSLQEHTGAIKTMSKGVGKEMEAMPTSLWNGIQDRSVAALRAMRNLREQGVFIYLTCSEAIDKDYVTDPRSKKQGEQVEAPYAVKGNVHVSGQVVQAVQHTTDIQLHARSVTDFSVGGASIIWDAVPTPIGGSGAMWEAKDRTGRIKNSRCPTNWRSIFNDIYGEERRKAIYAAGINSAR